MEDTTKTHEIIKSFFYNGQVLCKNNDYIFFVSQDEYSTQIKMLQDYYIEPNIFKYLYNKSITTADYITDVIKKDGKIHTINNTDIDAFITKYYKDDMLRINAIIDGRYNINVNNILDEL